MIPIHTHPPGFAATPEGQQYRDQIAQEEAMARARAEQLAEARAENVAAETHTDELAARYREAAKDGVPDAQWTKAKIQGWMTDAQIPYSASATKAELLEALTHLS